MKKILLVFIMSIFWFGLVSAGDPTLGTFKQGDCIDLIQTCSDCSYNNISKVQFPNATIIFENKDMTKDGTYYNYTFCNTTEIGEYLVHGFGDPASTLTIWDYTFKITYAGNSITSSQSILYLGLLGILIFTFIITLFGINKLPSRNMRDEEGRILSISYLKYLRDAGWMFVWMLVISILYLGSNLAFAYLNEQLFAQVLLTLFKVAFAVTPIIITVWLIWIFVSMFHDKQFQRILNRGMFPEGKR